MKDEQKSGTGMSLDLTVWVSWVERVILLIYSFAPPVRRQYSRRDQSSSTEGELNANNEDNS